MKTKEELHTLIEAFRLVTTEINTVINSKDNGDIMCIAMLLLPLLPAIDDFMEILKKETNEIKKEKPSSEDLLDNPLYQLKPNGSVS